MKALFFRKMIQFAGAVILFSVVRQLLVFPWLAREYIDTFSQVTFLVFTFEALLYLLIGAFPDFYAKNSSGGEVNAPLISRLLYLNNFGSIICFCLPLFGVDVLYSFLLFPFFVFSGRNALNLKLVFNKLDYLENYYYIVFRIFPYFSLFMIVWVEPYWVVALFCLCLSASEVFYSFRLSRVTAAYERGTSSVTSGLDSKALIVFCIAYIFISFAQRGDFTGIGYFYSSADYADFAMLMSVVNFFCNPVALVTGAGLLSLLVNQKVNFDLVVFFKVLFVVLFLSAFISVTAAALFGYVEFFLYGKAIGFSSFTVFFVVFCNIVFLSFRTLTVRFFSPVLLLVLYGVLCLLLAGLVMTRSLDVFLNYFYSLRALLVVMLFFFYVFVLRFRKGAC